MNKGKEPMVTVWDPLVRIGHWSLAIAFFVAYFTEDDLLSIHVWAGYAVGFIIVLRVFWGFIGSKHARFSDFLFGPWKVWRYLIDLIAFRAGRHLGHSPAGGAMVFALLIGLAATVWSGLEIYAIEENAGPLASNAAVSHVRAAALAPIATLSLASDKEEGTQPSEGKREKDPREEFWEETHEVLANIMLVLVILHILGVVLASVVHRENLARSMITGRKRAE